MTDNNKPVSVKRLIGVGVITRIFTDTSIQIFIPFLTIIAAGIGISNVNMGRLLSLRSIMGLSAPIIGSWADDHGYRRVIQLALFVTSLGSLIIGLSNSLVMTILGMVLTGISLSVFTPNLSAYLAARLPYAKRARGLGTLEYAWALASIIGLPIAGLLIAATNWRVPFFVLSGLIIIAAIGFNWLPEVVPEQDPTQPRTTFGQFFNFGDESRSAWGTVVTGYLIVFGAMHAFFSYGLWFVTEYGFDVSQLGRLALLVGIADICGSGLASFIDDILGKRRSVITGALIAVVGFAILPQFNTSIVPALIGLFIVRSLFEFTLVSNLILASEQLPKQRGKMLALDSSASTLAIFSSGLTSPRAYELFGIDGLAYPSMVLFACAAFCMWWFVVDKE